MEAWHSKWKINNEKSLHITVIHRQGIVPSIFLSNKIIPSVTSIKYLLNLILDYLQILRSDT